MEGEERCIKSLQERCSQYYTKERAQIVKDFKPRNSDVIIIGCCKSGTTWMQQIVHQLRTGGDMDFDEIIDVVPVIEMARDLKLDLNAEQKASPRCFKTHHFYHNRPKEANYIFCLREPCSTAYSAFKMFEGWFFQPGEISLNGYIREIWLSQHDTPQDKIDIIPEFLHFHHIVSWWPHREDPNMLPVFYEDLKESYETSVRSIAKFMNVHDEASIQAALQKSTFDYMKQNSYHFDQKRIKQSDNEAVFQLSEDAGVAKSNIRTGTTTEGPKMMSAQLHAEMQQKWEEIVTPVTGCSTYQELRCACRKKTA